MVLIGALIAITALVLALGARRKAEGLARKLEALAEADQRLERRILALRSELRADGARAEPPPAPAVVAPSEVAPPPPVPPPAAVASPPPPPASRPPLPTSPPPAPFPFHAVATPPAEAETPPASGTAVPEGAGGPKPAFDWEGLVGVKLFSWLAGIFLVMGALYFLGYSIQRGWLNPSVRMAIGLAVGGSLLLACELRAARRYAITANALDGAGIAILFSTFFSAHALWKLIPASGAFLALALVAAVAVGLAVRRDSLFIALLGLVGGFATPALLSAGEDRPIGLFGYLLLLGAGLAWVAQKKRWPVLSLLAVALTAFYQWNWVVRFLTEGSLPLAVGIFLVFPILGFAGLALGSRGDGAEVAFTRAASLGALPPLAFAVYLAAIPAYGAHYGLLFGFLFVMAAGLFLVAVWRGPDRLHLVGAGSTLLVFALWIGRSWDPGAWPGILAFVALFVGFFLAAPEFAERVGKTAPSESWTLGALAAPLLLFVFPALIYLEERTESPLLVFAALFVLMSVAAARAILRSEAPLHVFAAFFALAAETVWSAKYLSPGNLSAALALYGLFALFNLCVPPVAARLGKPLQAKGSIYLGLTGHVFLVAVALQPPLASPPWPLLGVLLILDLAVGAAALCARNGRLFAAAVAASALVLLVFEGMSDGGSWAEVSTLAALALSGLGIVWLALAMRVLGAKRGEGIRPFALGAAGSIVLAQLVAIMAASHQSGLPPLPFVVGAHLALLAAAVGLSWWIGWHGLPVFAMVPAFVAVSLWDAAPPGASWSGRLAFAAAVYAVYLLVPLALGRRGEKVREPYVAAVLASVPFFFLARWSLLKAGLSPWMGVLPVSQAAVLGVLLARLLSLEPPGKRELGRLGLVAGAVLAFVTVAIPLQLENEWVTLGWVLEGAALAWLFTKIPHRGLLASSAVLLTAAFCRLVLNPAVLAYHDRSATPIWNWYLYTYLVAATAFFAATWFLRRTDDSLGTAYRVSRFLPGLGTILLFVLVNIEVADFFATGERVAFHLADRSQAEDLTYTLVWALFAICLLLSGVVFRSAPARIAAIGLLVVTILKAFVHDLAHLEGLSRVASFVGLAVSLALVALAIQKFVLGNREEKP